MSYTNKTLSIKFLLVFFSLLFSHALFAALPLVGDTSIGSSDVLDNYGGPHLLTGNEDVYDFMLPSAGDVDFTLIPDVTFDGAMVVFTDLSDISSTMIVFADDGLEGVSEFLHFEGLSGYQYFIAVDGYSNSVGSYSLGSSQINLDLIPVNVVPVPAAVWLFGSGLVGLVGFARRKKS